MEEILSKGVKEYVRNREWERLEREAGGGEYAKGNRCMSYTVINKITYVDVTLTIDYIG